MTIPAAAVAILAAGIDDYRLTTPDHEQTPHGAAERAAEYLASSGYDIHIHDPNTRPPPPERANPVTPPPRT